MLTEKINSDFKKAMKEKDASCLSVLRLLKTAMTNKIFELKRDMLEDCEIISLIQKDIKRHLESIDQFKKGNRSDLAEKEEAELKILKSYMPKEASPEEIKVIVKNIIDETGASGKKDFGKVMKLAMEKLKGAADGKIISSIVNEILEK